MGRVNRFSLGQKIYPVSGEHRFHAVSFKGFVTDHSQWNRHQANGTSMATLVFPHSPCQQARSLYQVD